MTKDGSVQLYDLAEMQLYQMRKIDRAAFYILRLIISPDSTKALSLCSDGSIKIFDLNNSIRQKVLICSLTISNCEVEDPTFEYSPDGKYFCARNSKKISIYSAEDGMRVQEDLN